jgi:hypothetical protein
MENEMSINQKDERRRKKRRKDLRKGLLAFLKRLRKACESYESLADWNELIEPLESLIQEYAQEMPQGSAQQLRDAMRSKDATAQGIQTACQLLQGRLETVISLLPVGSILVPALVAAFIIVVAGVAASVIALNATAREVLIINHGCGDIMVPPLRLTIPGLPIPSEILNNQTASASIPGVFKVDVQVRKPEKMMTVWIFNNPLDFTFDNKIESLTFDGLDLTDQRTPLDFRTRPSHELVFTSSVTRKTSIASWPIQTNPMRWVGDQLHPAVASNPFNQE